MSTPIDASSLRFDGLHSRMRAKDADLYKRVSVYSWPAAIRLWCAQHPEDFASLNGADPIEYLHTKADEYIVLGDT